MARAGCAALALLLLLGVSSPPAARGEERRRRRNEPHAGYVFPAGGRVGTTVRVAVGGQGLRRVTGVHVSGEGVTGRIVHWIPPFRPLDGPQRRELQRRLAVLRAAKAPATGRPAKGRRPPPPAPAKPVKLPEHPLLENLEKKSLEELEEVARYFFQRRNPLQRKRAIEETVKVDLRIDTTARPGLRELRLVTQAGLSNPLRLRIDLLPEVKEREPNDPGARPGRAHALPVVFNGQIMPRDVDRHAFEAKAGQQLVLRAEARSLIPYQADSVPGWMQATIALLDPQGREVAYADEYRFDPDPVLFYRVPADGIYTLEVRDAIARGRADFVYRVAVGELPFVTRIFPLGGRAGTLTRVAVEGVNLRQETLPLDTRADGASLRLASWRQRDVITNEVGYAVDDLPETTEREGAAEDLRVELPIVVNGRIDAPDDVDRFAFEGRSGQEVVLEVRARALGSPLDAVLRLLGPKGEVLAWNDDHRREGLGVRGLGLQTHQADSYLRARLPRRGLYRVQIGDVRGHGSADHAYRLRISPPRPDFELYVTPSAVNLAAGRTELVSLYAVRRDGFAGDIDVELASGPRDFALSGARVPAGRDHIDLTLTAPIRRPAAPVALGLVGVVRSGRTEIRRPVVPADNVMQAFLWRHLVPAEEFAAYVSGNGRWVPVVTLAEKRPVKLRRGRTTEIHFRASRKVPIERLAFDLIGGPKGVTVQAAEARHDGFLVILETSREAERSAAADNLLLEMFDRPPPPKGTRADGPTRPRRSIGVLPAVPYVIRR